MDKNCEIVVVRVIICVVRRYWERKCRDVLLLSVVDVESKRDIGSINYGFDEYDMNIVVYRGLNRSCIIDLVFFGDRLNDFFFNLYKINYL